MGSVGFGGDQVGGKHWMRGGLATDNPEWIALILAWKGEFFGVSGGCMTVTEMVQPEAGSGVGEFYVREYAAAVGAGCAAGDGD